MSQETHNTSADCRILVYPAVIIMTTDENQRWYYTIHAEGKVGPIPVEQLRSLVLDGKLDNETLVWTPGYESWMKVKHVSDVLGLEQKPVAPPPIPPAMDPPAEVVVEEKPVEEIKAPAKPRPAPSPSVELKPRKASFLFARTVALVIASLFVTIVSALVLFLLELPIVLAAAVFLGILGLGIYANLVAYRKERYEIHDTRLLCHKGGIFSDETTELEMRNVTHIKVKFPWLRYKLFGIGIIMVESAGTSQPMKMFAIREPDSVYEDLQARLQKNGFDLTKERLLHEERPALIGAIGECFGISVGALFGLLFIVPTIIGITHEMDAAGVSFLAPILIAVVMLTLLSFAVLRFLDIRRRTYRVYNDAVVYEEGFLTRNNAFIPYENIADSNTKRTVIDNILGLYDVHISCQGSSSEIKFRRLKNGAILSNVIDQLVNDASKKPKPAPPGAEDDAEGASKVRYRREEPDNIPVESTVVGDFRMHGARVYVPLLLFLPIFPLWVIAMISALIRTSCTEYSLRPGTLRHSFKFLSTNVREFSYDKITGVVIKKNIWDKIFGTITVKFWSIGSSHSMEFAHVHASAFDLPALMRQAGIPPSSPAPYEAKVKFGLMTWARAGFGGVIFFVISQIFILGIAGLLSLDADAPGILVFVAIIEACIFGLIIVASFVRALLYYKKQTLSFHEHHVEAKQGIIFVSHYFVRYKNIKRVKSKLYPFGRDGALEIYAAGEELAGTGNAQQQQQSQKGIHKQYSFSTGFLPQAREVGMLLDDILCGRVNPSADAVTAEPFEPILVSPRDMKNALVKLVLLSVIVFPLIALLPITIPWTIVRIRKWKYEIDATHVSKRHGVFYRSLETTLLDRVDSQQQKQGPLNKMFNNGDVTIMTAGSSKPDMAIVDTADYKQFYDLIRQSTQ